MADNYQIIEYKDSHIQTLIGEMKGYESKLVSDSADLGHAHDGIMAIWQSQEGSQNYLGAYQNFATALQNVIGILADGTETVDNATVSAFLADKKVGGMFL